MKYVDITDKYAKMKKYIVKKQCYFVDDQGKRYEVDNKYVVLEPTQREIEVAGIIGRALGGIVRIIPRVNEPEGIKTPDYIINNDKFDLKEITGKGKYVIEGNLKKKERQSNNFIIDLSNTKIEFKEVQRQIESIFISKRYLWIDRIFIIKGKLIVKVYKRNKSEG